MTLEEASDKLANYLTPYLQNRRESPGDDLLSRIANGLIDGQKIPLEDAVNVASLALFGGLDTVVAMLGNVFYFLATHPEERRFLADDPSRVMSAVDEMLRRFPIGITGRLVVEDVEVGGVRLKKDDLVLLPTMLHGLDEREYACPMKFDMERRSAATSTFGNGHHLCPGRPLARTELAITVEEWLARIPEFEIAPGTEITMTAGHVNTVDALPLRWKV
jgi:cytochrome P450